jgi:hypothetical protein
MVMVCGLSVISSVPLYAQSAPAYTQITPQSSTKAQSSSLLDAQKSLVIVGSVETGSITDSAVEDGLEGENDYVSYTVAAAVREMEADGITCLPPASAAPDEVISSDFLKAACLEAGVRWVIAVYTEYVGERFSWRISIYDGEEGAFRGSDGFSLFIYTGVSALHVIDSSAAMAVQSWRNSLASTTIQGKTAVTIRQKFSSSQDGVTVRFGQDPSGGFIEAGVIEDGELLAPYIPFVEGLPIYGEVSLDGYWTKRFVLPNGISSETFKLPALQWKLRHSFGFSLDLRGVIPQGIDIEYRLHVLPDRFFLRLDWALWMDRVPVLDTAAESPENTVAADAVPAPAALSLSENMLHQEFRFSPGLYLLPWTDSVFRIVAGTGISGALVNGNFTLVPDPLWAAAEFHFPRFLIKAEVRLPWFLGYTRTAFGDASADMGIYFSAGVMLKW